MEGNMMDREFDWDDEIEKDAGEFVLLPAGEYDFKVISFERGRHSGSEKLPPCNKAIVKIQIDSNIGSAYIEHQLFLHTKTEGLLSAFFSSIGLKQKGEKLRMNWNLVPGSTGRCKVIVNDWTDRDGNKRQSNRIDRFIPKDYKPVFQAGTF